MSTPWWHQPLRIVQVNLQVVDSPQLDPMEVMRQLKEDLHANAVVFNAGGIYAFYPTRVPGHFVNPCMDGRDLLGESLAAAHRYGLKFIARVDFSKADDSIYQQRPEWFVKDATGQPVAIGEPRYGHWSLLYATCTNGGYCGADVAHPVMREMLTNYAVDALFYNGAGYRECHCATCQNKYRELYGQELPADAKAFPDSWRSRSFLDNMRGIYQVCRESRPDVPWLGGFGLAGGRDVTAIRQYADVACSEPLDYYAGGYDERRPYWWSGMTSNLGRVIGGGIPPIVIIHATTGMTTRHVSLPERESCFWLAQVVAHGGNIWHTLTGIPNTQYDTRILDCVGEFNALAEKHQDALANVTPVAPVAVVYSGASLQRGARDELYGFVEALVNHQIPFTFLLAEAVTEETLAGLDVVVLPSVSVLSDRAVAALAAFRAQGGGLVVSYETSLYDERGACRHTLALGQALAVRFAGHRLRDQVTSYMRIENASHPLLKGITHTEFVLNMLDMLQVTTDAEVPLTLVPPFAVPSAAGSPPERASIPTKQTTIPTAVATEHSVYFAGEIGRMAWKYRQPDHQDLIANAVRAVARHPLPVEIRGPHSLQMALYRQADGYVLHLVNATGDRPLQDTIPIHNVSITLRLGGSTMHARALMLEADLPCVYDGEAVTLTVPVVSAWEIVRLTPG